MRLRLPRTARYALLLTLPAALLVGVACSNEDEERIEDAAQSVATRAAEVATQAQTAAANAATQARTAVAEADPRGTSTPASGAGGQARDATIQNRAFEPREITVSRGATVTWTNQDSVPHTVTGEGANAPRSDTLQQGARYSFTFTNAGTFNYVCTIHPSMRGTVIVQ